MTAQLQAEFQERTDHLLAGRFDRLIADYDPPVPVWLDGRKLVASTQEDIFLMCYNFHEALAARGIKKIKANVTAQELPRNGRFRVWVQWENMSQNGSAPALAKTIYYCRRDQQRLRLQMVEYTKLGIPELNDTCHRQLVSV